MKQQKIKLIIAIITGCFASFIHAEAVWIDTDPACGISRTSDVDDCWALHMAIHSPDLEIHGISTVFGNSDGATTYKKAKDITLRFNNDNTLLNIYRGADQKLDRQNTQPTEASTALSRTLAQGKITIIALGPVTNIATLLQLHPELSGQISQLIAVAGKRDQHGFGFYPGDTSFLHLHDFNFRKDVEAFDVVLNSDIPIILIPYEVASKVTILPADLAQLETSNNDAQWLANISQHWMTFWKEDLKAKGFFPFDSLAVAYAINNESFQCKKLPVKIERHRSLFVGSRDDLVVSQDKSNGRFVHYCHNVKTDLKPLMMSTLKSRQPINIQPEEEPISNGHRDPCCK
ncbi:MAG: nucleoside hydrolase [Gammaproteobacteria bacterium]